MSPTNLNNDHQAHRLPPLTPEKRIESLREGCTVTPSTTARRDNDDENDIGPKGLRSCPAPLERYRDGTARTEKNSLRREDEAYLASSG